LLHHKNVFQPKEEEKFMIEKLKQRKFPRWKIKRIFKTDKFWICTDGLNNKRHERFDKAIETIEKLLKEEEIELKKLKEDKRLTIF